MVLVFFFLCAAQPRSAVNAQFAERNVPLFWREDANKNGQPDPQELVFLWGMDSAREAWIDKEGALTERAQEALLPEAPSEDKRISAVVRELAQAQPALVYDDSKDPFVAKMFDVGLLIDKLYALQMGASELERLLPSDAPSHALFFRNHGPWCAAPATEKDPDCHAISSKPLKLSSLYPSALQSPGFCDKLLTHPFASTLFHPFSVVRGDEALRPVPYHIVYSSEMEAVAKALRAAADVLTPNETAMKAYLLAAAQAFRDNQWQVADEAWVKTAGASKWYVRVGPDEVYADPCGRKAVFALSFGTLSESSQRWQTMLEPLKQSMEDTMAVLAGEPYKARAVTFRLPDFIDVKLNAGDSRLPFGATVGQSLPVFGKVAKEGRRRTVAMANLFTDDDSQALIRKQAESIFCPEVMKHFGVDARMKLMSTVLHEASHNLGPTGFYAVDGKTSPAIFGGAISLLLSELHAQTAALFYAEWLVKKGLLKPEEALQAHVRDLHWAFDQIARGITKPYGQLGVIQMGWLLREGALVWRNDCIAIEQAKLEPAIASLTTHISRIKAKGDKKAIEQLMAEMTVSTPVVKAITERFARFPKINLVYGFEQ